MDAILSNDEKPNVPSFSEDRETKENGRLKVLLIDLIGSSIALDVRVWLDGVYTDIGDDHVVGNWMNDREVYFKVEGRVDKNGGS